jgi:hypothetical protein
LAISSLAARETTISWDKLTGRVDKLVTLVTVAAGEGVEVEVFAQRIDLLAMSRLEVVALIARGAGVVDPSQTAWLADHLTFA